MVSRAGANCGDGRSRELLVRRPTRLVNPSVGEMDGFANVSLLSTDQFNLITPP